MIQGTLQQVSGIVADVLGVPVNLVTADSGPDTLEAWDSVQHLNVILAIEQSFDFQLDPKEIEGTKNVAAIAAIVDRKLSGS